MRIAGLERTGDSAGNSVSPVNPVRPGGGSTVAARRSARSDGGPRERCMKRVDCHALRPARPSELSSATRINGNGARWEGKKASTAISALSGARALRARVAMVLYSTLTPAGFPPGVTSPCSSFNLARRLACASSGSPRFRSVDTHARLYHSRPGELRLKLNDRQNEKPPPYSSGRPRSNLSSLMLSIKFSLKVSV